MTVERDLAQLPHSLASPRDAEDGRPFPACSAHSALAPNLRSATPSRGPRCCCSLLTQCLRDGGLWGGAALASCWGRWGWKGERPPSLLLQGLTSAQGLFPVMEEGRPVAPVAPWPPSRSEDLSLPHLLPPLPVRHAVSLQNDLKVALTMGWRAGARLTHAEASPTAGAAGGAEAWLRRRLPLRPLCPQPSRGGSGSKNLGPSWESVAPSVLWFLGDDRERFQPCSHEGHFVVAHSHPGIFFH